MAKLTKKEIQGIHDYTTYGMTDRELRSRVNQHKKMTKNAYWKGQAWMSDYNKVVSQLGFSSRAVDSYDFLRRNAIALQQRSESWDKGYSKLRKEQIKRENKKLGGFK
tara:strand:+ start:15 stop:338 length:324 start_codon:yes stop_codon:yes gene_type:complete